MPSSAILRLTRRTIRADHWIVDGVGNWSKNKTTIPQDDRFEMLVLENA